MPGKAVVAAADVAAEPVGRTDTAAVAAAGAAGEVGSNGAHQRLLTTIAVAVEDGAGLQGWPHPVRKRTVPTRRDRRKGSEMPAEAADLSGHRHCGLHSHSQQGHTAPPPNLAATSEARFSDAAGDGSF